MGLAPDVRLGGGPAREWKRFEGALDLSVERSAKAETSRGQAASAAGR